MSAAVPVALVGFTAFEHNAFDSYFRLAVRRSPSYVLCQRLSESRLAVVNADDDEACAQVTRCQRLADCLMLGATPRPGAAQQLPRPINLMRVVRTLDTLLQRQPGISKSVQRVLDDLFTVTNSMAAPINPREMAAAYAAQEQARAAAADADTDAAAAHAPDAPSSGLRTAHERPGADHILVVDARNSAMRFMVHKLQPFGFQVHLARSAAEAVDRVSRRHFELVFVDVSMADLHGLKTCRTIKRVCYPGSRPKPTVVVLTQHDTPLDALPGAEDGCDAYLLRPLQEPALLKLVSDREVAKLAFEETSQPASTLI